LFWEHNLFVVNVALTGKRRAGTRAERKNYVKGRVWIGYPEELDLRTAYWWSPDLHKIASLEMDESMWRNIRWWIFPSSFKGERTR